MFHTRVLHKYTPLTNLSSRETNHPKGISPPQLQKQLTLGWSGMFWDTFSKSLAHPQPSVPGNHLLWKLVEEFNKSVLLPALPQSEW